LRRNHRGRRRGRYPRLRCWPPPPGGAGGGGRPPPPPVPRGGGVGGQGWPRPPPVSAEVTRRNPQGTILRGTVQDQTRGGVKRSRRRCPIGFAQRKRPRSVNTNDGNGSRLHRGAG